ncbi:MAG: porin family protein [Candidatus Deferrimicrobiaceae bacterium]
MRKSVMLFLVGLLCAALTSTVWAQRYDRYEKYGGPPPRRGAGAPPPQHAVYGQPYVFGHLGLFEPNNDSAGLEGYDTGGAFDIGIGSRVSPVLAIDGTFGLHAAERGSDDVTVAPLTFGLRLILPSPVIEPYVGAGLGIYFTSLNEPSTGLDDSDTTFGGYGSLGVDAWLTPRMALNFEGKYHWVEPQFNRVDVDVSGWTLSLGIRVSF